MVLLYAFSCLRPRGLLWFFVVYIDMLLSKKKLKFFRLLVMASTLFLDQKGAAENDFDGYEL